MKRKTEITFESEEFVLFKPGKSFTEFCPFCGKSVAMLTTECAAAMSGLGEREIFRLIEAGEIHFVEAERVFVCRSSLSEAYEVSKWKIENP